MEHRSHIYGVMGEFGTPEQLIHAARKVREAGYRHVDAYAPFPVEGLSEALRLHRSWVPLITLLGGLAGGLAFQTAGSRCSMRIWFMRSLTAKIRTAAWSS